MEVFNVILSHVVEFVIVVTNRWE